MYNKKNVPFFIQEANMTKIIELPLEPEFGGCDPAVEDVPDFMPEEVPVPVTPGIPVEIPDEARI